MQTMFDGVARLQLFTALVFSPLAGSDRSKNTGVSNATAPNVPREHHHVQSRIKPASHLAPQTTPAVRPRAAPRTPCFPVRRMAPAPPPSTTVASTAQAKASTCPRLSVKGVVKKWIPSASAQGQDFNNGYGFIASADGSGDVWCHSNDLPPGARLIEGMPVSFEVIPNMPGAGTLKGKPRAYRISGDGLLEPLRDGGAARVTVGVRDR